MQNELLQDRCLYAADVFYRNDGRVADPQEIVGIQHPFQCLEPLLGDVNAVLGVEHHIVSETLDEDDIIDGNIEGLLAVFCGEIVEIHLPPGEDVFRPIIDLDIQFAKLLHDGIVTGEHDFKFHLRSSCFPFDESSIDQGKRDFKALEYLA